jgi:hypothetical protein
MVEGSFVRDTCDMLRTKPLPRGTDKNFSKDLVTFEQLPAKTKELELLKDRAEKAAGPEHAALHKLIRERS